MSPLLAAAWHARSEEANRSAVFLPQTTDDELPCINVGGVLVFLYLDPNDPGLVRVSVDLDTADPDLLDQKGCLPLRIQVGDATVYDEAERRS